MYKRDLDKSPGNIFILRQEVISGNDFEHDETVYKQQVLSLRLQVAEIQELLA